MAADNYIQLSPNTALGGQIWQMHQLLLQLEHLANEVNGALAQAASDDPSDATGLVATLIGTAGANKTANAVGIRNLVGSVRSNLGNLSGEANAFLQFRDRLGLNF